MDPKMAAYCQVVRDLEGKFHGLEVYHVLRDYNKAVDVLAKTVSNHSPVPHGVFTSDQHAPSVRAEHEKPPEESELEVMAVDQPPELNLEDPDWRFPILEWLVEGKLPSDQTEARRIARRAKSVRAHRQRALQAWGYQHTHAVHLRRSRSRAIARDTCWHLRSPRRSENTCWKGFSTRFLLAHGVGVLDRQPTTGSTRSR
jgi:hypothetical protein